MSHRAILFGGPVEGKVIEEVPEGTFNIRIPARRLDKYALYVRTGEETGPTGRYLRFDFKDIYDQNAVITK